MRLFSHKNIVLIVATSLLMSGCGSDNGGTDEDLPLASKGYLSDDRVAGVSYDCGTLGGLTDVNGSFEYDSSCNEVEFTIGSIRLGSIATNSITGDGIIYPADILGLDRNNTTDPQLVNMLRLIQSLDSDNNPSNGIDINSSMRTALQNSNLLLDANTTTADINTTLSNVGVNLISEARAIAFYENTLRNEQNLIVNTLDPDVLDEIIVDAIQTNLISSTNPREAATQQNWNIGDPTEFSFSLQKEPSVETQEDNATVTITKGDVNATFSFIETIPFSQPLRDKVEIDSASLGLAQSENPRTYTYQPEWTTGEDLNITWSEEPRTATVETQDYNVTATLVKGTQTDIFTFQETILFSQELRDIAEVAKVKEDLNATMTPRTYTYQPQWTTGEDLNITWSEIQKTPTTETQIYNVTATLSKGNTTDTFTFSETIPFSQDLRDIAEVASMKTQFDTSAAKRAFTYTPLWQTGDSYAITFSEAQRTATTEDQTYQVTATLSKGSASDQVTYIETVPYSQVLRDEIEVANIVTGLSQSQNPRTYTYTQQWPSGDSYTIAYDPAMPKIPTAVDQTYTVNVLVTKGSSSYPFSFTETVPTTNVNIDVGEGSTVLINDEYQDAYTVTNGGIFQKIDNEDEFVGTAFSLDASTLSQPISSSNELLNYIVTQSGLSNFSSISVNNNSDGSLVARYELTSFETNLYEVLETLLGSVNYTISESVDFTQYQDINSSYVDLYVEYKDNENSYVIIALTDQSLDFKSDIVKIINKDSVIEADEVIVNNQETFTYVATQPKGDFLFVVDDSGSMSEEQAAAIDAIERTFTASINKYNLDWKATVIGTEEGRNYDSLVQNPSENNISALVADLDSLVVSGGDEVGLKRAYNFLTNGDIVERNDSSLTVVYVSDELCHSDFSEIGLSEENLANSYFVQNDIRVNAVIPVDRSYEDGSSYVRADDLAYKMSIATNGDVANLRNYTYGYDEMMDNSVRYAIAKSSSIKLQYPAISSSITVHINGSKVISWEYDPEARAIVFVANAPADGDEVTVTYSHLDYESMVQSAKEEFDSLADDQKRAYTNNNVTVTFDPEQPQLPLHTGDQSYTVNVNFDAYGYSTTSSFTETIEASDFEVTANTDWSQKGTTFTSQNKTRYSTSTLSLTVQNDVTFNYSVNSYGFSYGRLYIVINGSSTYYYGTAADSFDVVAGDILEFRYEKSYTSTYDSTADEAIITFQ